MEFQLLRLRWLYKERLRVTPKLPFTHLVKLKKRKADSGFLANPKYEEHLYSTNASIIIINESQELKKKFLPHS